MVGRPDVNLNSFTGKVLSQTYSAGGLSGRTTGIGTDPF